MVEHDEYLEALQDTLAHFKELTASGLPSMKAARAAAKGHHTGMERDEYGVPVVLYAGRYVLVFGQRNEIYKRMEETNNVCNKKSRR